MTRWLLVVISVILLATVTPIHDSAIAQNQGAIRGVVANGTTNTFVPDVHVLLQIIRNGIPMETLETKTDAEGHFRFGACVICVVSSARLQHSPTPASRCWSHLTAGSLSDARWQQHGGCGLS